MPKTRVNCVKVSGKDAWDPGSQEPASYRGLYIYVITYSLALYLLQGYKHMLILDL